MLLFPFFLISLWHFASLDIKLPEKENSVTCSISSSSIVILIFFSSPSILHIFITFDFLVLIFIPYSVLCSCIAQSSYHSLQIVLFTFFNGIRIVFAVPVRPICSWHFTL